MKKLACALALILLTPSVYAERIALLIGNASYRSAPLRNPVNDVNAMSRKLRSLGFTVIAKHNLNRQQMRQTVRSFKQRLRRGDTALLYYSGHGVQVKGQNYLLPINNGIMDAFDISDGGVSLNFLLGNLNSSFAKEKIVILDACRDNPFKSRIKNLSKGLSRINGALGGTGTLVAFSAESGQVSNDGRGVNGIYTKHLLRHISTAGISLNQMFMRVRRDVARETKGRQVPKEDNGLVNQIYLAEGKGNNPSPVVAKTAPRVNNNAGHNQQWYIDRWNRSQSNNSPSGLTVQSGGDSINSGHAHRATGCSRAFRHNHKFNSSRHTHKYGCSK